MLKHKFTLRETIFMLVAVVLALGIFYYQVILKGYTNAKKQYDTTNLQDEQTVLLAKAAKLKTMEDYIESHEGESYGEVAVYNNLANEMDALAAVFNGKVGDVSIDYNDPYVINSIVRREASISFKTSSYSQAKELVQAISDLKYRCIITELSMSDDDTNNLESSNSISVTLQVTFFETTEGATNTNGLVVEEDDTSALETLQE